MMLYIGTEKASHHGDHGRIKIFAPISARNCVNPFSNFMVPDR